MTETQISIEDLFKKYNIQPHDLEYILNFMQKENITPQLAMRRIKMFEKLQEKMEQSQSDDKVKELTTELDHLSKVVEDLQSERDSLQEEKVKLDKEIEDTKLEQDLFNAEREELKLQMHALMDSIGDIEHEAEEGGEKLSSENQELKKKLSMMVASSQTLKDKMLKIGSENPSLRSLIQDIERGLLAVIDGKQIPTDIGFTVPTELIATSTQPTASKIETPVKVKEETVSETISPDQIQFDTPSTSTESTPEAKPAGSQPTSTPAVSTPESSKPIIKEKLFAEPEEIEKAIPEPAPTSEPASVPKTEPEKPKPKPTPVEEPKKVDVTKKPTTDGKAVSAKIEKILKLFISYAEQADTDENWKARVAAICDMDEAYIELGGLAMSQIYAYQTKTIKKKSEFERLLKSWMENGLPR
ncbi:MAG: hypothetical protein H7641_01430 [Candidatus Heimdallarchaeota archaeon]|nr:hypothetical protein [Candidatus Heimdallarchaeota archaeon]MCK4876225.1 hypothetical protein [Candidatus Heimdallarchaeota archaeon]